MKKLVLLSAILLGATAASQAGVSVNFGFGIPLPPPPQVVISAPAPVYVDPAPVYAPCEPPPVVYAPPVVCAPPVVDFRFRFGEHRESYWRHERDEYRGHGYRGHGEYREHYRGRW